MTDLEMMKHLFGDDLVIATDKDGVTRAIMFVGKVDSVAVYSTFTFDTVDMLKERKYYIQQA